MWPGCEPQEQIMRPAEDRVVARRQIVQRRILDDEVALPHRAANVDDGMAGGAAETGLRLGCVDLLSDRLIEAAVEEDRMIVTTRAPLRRRSADHVLHILDRPAIPLVVERREVMG